MSSSKVLMDKDFLKKLDEYNEREVYVKIISLDFAENPRSEIQGYTTGGSINVNGTSSVRRTCSLTMVTKNAMINEIDWALETKFKLQIGLKNYINPAYDEIIWFPQGTYILTSFTFTSNMQGFTISLQGKDKMCLLDGSIGGSIFASHDFGKIEITHKGEQTFEYDYILIHDIIKNAVHEYAFEPYENIIINDLEDCSVEMIEYLVDNLPMLIYNQLEADGAYNTNIAFEGNNIYTLLKDCNENDIVESEFGTFQFIKKAEYGSTVGYRLTDLVYPSGQDLILKAGSSITQMLDKIIQILGDFEYFYNLDGQFVFQRKKIYLNVSWNNTVTNEQETRYDSIENGSANAYEFTKGVLIESYNNKPNISNIKNDYAIWGNREGVSGDQLAIHLRCAIDTKPISYKPLLDQNIENDELQPNGTETISTYAFEIDEFGDYVLDSNGNKIPVSGYYDWREIIYRMAYDYSKSDAKIKQYSEQLGAASDINVINQLKNEIAKWERTWDTRYISYYTDLLGYWRFLYDPNKQEWLSNQHWNPDYVVCKINEKNNENRNNDTIILKNHETIPFWLDFIDGGYLEKYKPVNIGRRPKVINDTQVKAIFFERTPDILFIDISKGEPHSYTKLSYAKLNLIDDWSNYFKISTQGKSAKETLDNLLYTHTYYCESITINCIPIYYLEPNTRISISDYTSGIIGEYIIQSFNIPLAYNGSMSITATKAEDLIL